ncbi:hypothetical protein PEC18_28870 [Paucibacter sp. O1-1]|uniref:hypothetical protein n=1 Tax=Roseateles TaxID=93681 RepID=UPI0010F65E49|nr:MULTISPECIES: hypothetical protein [unclassified Roseateles]MCU7374750.1 hypothetical protein [Paucibacter sp. O1-1]MCX2862474.1 hypothetical protein [Paucibacter sp. PLA-PC-4]MCZ7882031.1 hypothetical protein [Paucibacter sp. M5-1]MDA3829752.1 hypothetical protein [Paucibacter sp. O1-1]MDC6167687.1 hypothetical protein [Paucibacter sp. XJ19-41]
MSNFDRSISSGMWRVVFYERRGNRVQMDRTGPWLPNKKLAEQWAHWFGERGHHVALQDQSGGMEKVSQGLPG